MSHTVESLGDECIIPNPMLKLIAYSTGGVYVTLLISWLFGLLLPTQVVVTFIIYTLFAGLLTVRHISILRKPAKILLLGVVYAGFVTILQSQIF